MTDFTNDAYAEGWMIGVIRQGYNDLVIMQNTQNQSERREREARLIRMFEDTIERINAAQLIRDRSNERKREDAMARASEAAKRLPPLPDFWEPNDNDPSPLFLQNQQEEVDASKTDG